MSGIVDLVNPLDIHLGHRQSLESMEVIPPILHREFLVRSRQRSSYMVRPLASLVSLLIVAGILGIPMLFGNGSVQLGMPAFRLCASFLWLFCFVEGLRNSSDCLSSEKREGTIGLLFLTRMNGLHVAIGKLSSGMISSVFNLVAALPILGLPILIGGVTFPEYMRVCLALVTTLGVTLAIGVLVSAFSQFAGRALGASLAVILVWNLTSTIASEAMGYLVPSPQSLFSGSFDMTFRSNPSTFWISLLVLWSVTLVIGFLAGFVVERRWQAKLPLASDSSRKGAKRMWQWLWPSKERRVSSKRPLEWLLERNSFLRYGKRGLLLMVILGVLSAFAAPLHTGIKSACSWIILGLVVWEGCRLFVGSEGRAWLELVLTTPVRLRDFLDELRRFAKRFALYGALLMLALEMIVFVGELISTLAGGAVTSLSPLIPQQAFSPSGGADMIKIFGAKLILLCLEVATMYFWLYGAFWYSFWRGIQSKSVTSALGWILLVTVLAYVVYLWLGTALLMFAVIQMGARFVSSPFIIVHLLGAITSALTIVYFLRLAKLSSRKFWFFLCPSPPLSHARVGFQKVSLR